ncbi:MAG: YraN family protein [Anaerolineae bacterium]|nr:YraN family protein [Anaerolineae bacterium]
MDKRKQTGRRGEDIAAAFLIKRGYRIIDRNWSCPTGELDLVAEDDGTLIFVEVRTRQSTRLGTAEESVTLAKQTRLIELAELYLQAMNPPHSSWRIDVIAIQLGHGLPQVNHIENAIGW